MADREVEGLAGFLLGSASRGVTSGGGDLRTGEGEVLHGPACFLAGLQFLPVGDSCIPRILASTLLMAGLLESLDGHLSGDFMSRAL